MDKGLIIHAVIYNAERKVLIIRRAKVNDALPEYWDIPGGTLEDGEDPAVGAMRETKEETGLEIYRPAAIFRTFERRYRKEQAVRYARLCGEIFGRGGSAQPRRA